MQLTHQGWSEEKGYFQDKYNIDTISENLEIRWGNGTISKQISPFQIVEADWNCDGDVYEEFGAYFEGKYGGRDWHTPQGLLRLVLDDEAIVKGIRKL